MKEYYKILKRKPKGLTEYDFTPTTYGIPQGKDKEGHWKPWKHKPLVIGDWYDIETDEPGQELRFKAEFIGWKKEITVYDDKRIPDNISYLAIFKAVGDIEIDTDYSLGLERSEEQNE